jgi:hypothetical protein
MPPPDDVDDRRDPDDQDQDNEHPPKPRHQDFLLCGRMD